MRDERKVLPVPPGPAIVGLVSPWIRSAGIHRTIAIRMPGAPPRDSSAKLRARALGSAGGARQDRLMKTLVDGSGIAGCRVLDDVSGLVFVGLSLRLLLGEHKPA